MPGGLSGPSAHFFSAFGALFGKVLGPFLGPSLEGLSCRLYWVPQKMGPAISIFSWRRPNTLLETGGKKVREWLKRLAHLRPDSNYIKCSAKAHLGRAGDRKCKKSSSV